LKAPKQPGEMTVIEGTKRVGADAVEAGRLALLEATGASSLEEATRIALGRPRLSDISNGPLPELKKHTHHAG
jgi:hypothetical protein